MTKPIWTSKTFYFNLILKLVGVIGLFYPQVNNLLAQHPSAIMILIGLIGLLLRLVTAGKVTLTNDLPASPSSASPSA